MELLEESLEESLEEFLELFERENERFSPLESDSPSTLGPLGGRGLNSPSLLGRSPGFEFGREFGLKLEREEFDRLGRSPKFFLSISFP